MYVSFSMIDFQRSGKEKMSFRSLTIHDLMMIKRVSYENTLLYHYQNIPILPPHLKPV